ncbi:hypothetical protein BOTBODRAFT_65592 [Botryobasidium botryosum FD-172 SS1]|uniref:Early meiotic induction protein 1 n=1 Tax=Botryobasidium botryosum (strain FD-172 SS1) TaxID=930990 RepID=A0A067MTL1_BOTB1|nr:hypothetical protein BOTBODRAFT_65592 [Botryobasidium botryosum FD-172 SS1]
MAAARDFGTVEKQEEAYLSVVHPTAEDIPGCMKLLDDFLICYALGPQMKSLYRHGTLGNCDSKLSEFKFCLSLKSLEPEEKRKAWLQRRAKWWASRRLGQSSEDVWEMRSKPLEGFPPPPSEMFDRTSVKS